MNARYGYGFNLGKSRDLLIGDDFGSLGCSPQTETVGCSSYTGHCIFKFQQRRSRLVTLKERPYTKQFGTQLSSPSFRQNG